MLSFLYKKRPKLGANGTGSDVLERPYYFPLNHCGGTGEVPQKVWQVVAPSFMIYGGGAAINDVNVGGEPYYQWASTSLTDPTQVQVTSPGGVTRSPGTFGNAGAF